MPQNATGARPILITGARGHVAQAVVAQLLAAGVPVRAVSRDPESASLPAQVEVARANLAEPETLRAALDGVGRVFLYAEPQGIEGVLEAARAAGVEQIVLLSSSAVVARHPEASPIAQRHLVVEQAIVASGLPWTFVRPGAFATNALQWAPSIKAAGLVRAPYPEAQMAPIHEQDIAAVAVAALVSDGHAGQAYVLTGPESLTQRRQVELISEAIGRPIRFEALTTEQAREQFGRFMPPPIVETFLGYLAAADGKPAPVLNTVQDVTGRPGRTFAEWATDHAADFR
jgi:uncharacterized protein YbjT (DUF2867 family)